MMTQRTPAIAVLLAAAAFATGASLAGDRSGAAALSDARKGEAVDRICLASELSDWTEQGEGAVIVRRGPQEYYLVTLVGACRTDLSRGEIAIASRSGSPCLQRADDIRTAREVGFGQACTVEGLYRWNAQDSDSRTSGAGRSE